MTEECRKFLVPAAEIEDKADTFSHPFNEKSQITGTHLSRQAGLQRAGVSKVMVPPGKEVELFDIADARPFFADSES